MTRPGNGYTSMIISVLVGIATAKQQHRSESGLIMAVLSQSCGCHHIRYRATLCLDYRSPSVSGDQVQKVTTDFFLRLRVMLSLERASIEVLLGYSDGGGLRDHRIRASMRRNPETVLT